MCPCGTEKPYDACCGRFITGLALPDTAEQLMRSRYTAYTQANIAYIQATMKNKALTRFNPARALEWAKQNTWSHLKVYDAFPHDTDENIAYVKFSAYYWHESELQTLTETSEFKRINQQWFYVNRIIPPF